MFVIRKSLFTSVMNEMDLPITQEQLDEFESDNSRLVQDVFPNLNSEQREFLMTGSTSAEWEDLFGGEDE
jgi:hypothetical protein